MARVLVVGGASGIGAASVRTLRANGDSVVVADLDAARARSVAAEPLLGKGYALTCDMAEPDSPRQTVDAAVDAMGGVDVVFANAGVLHSAALSEWTVDAWDHSLAVNLRAPFLLAQAAEPHLHRSELPSLLFTASTGAFRGHAGMPAYHASKAGLVNLVRALADELSPSGIRVNAVCPGWVDTPFNDPFWSFQADPRQAKADLEASIPLRRQAGSDDVADVVAFLCSSAARYITGQAIVVDGGYTAV